MIFFGKKPMSCITCGVHYDPVSGYEAKWGMFCKTHRETVMKKDIRKEIVMAWAELNWEKIEPVMIEEKKKFASAFFK